MHKRLNNLIFPLVIVCVCLVLTNSCEKDDDNEPSLTGWKTTAIFNPDITYGTMTDQDGNVYKTVTIGSQIWMAENLRTTKYNDATSIPNVIDDHEWEELKTGAYCNYNTTISEDTITTYGRLYNWYTINTGLLAPKGWHVPTDEEWKLLEIHLGMSQSEADGNRYRGTDEGGKLKEEGTTHWLVYNPKSTNLSGFTALPGGYRFDSGSFYYLGFKGYWWSASKNSTSNAWYRRMYNYISDIQRLDGGMLSGFSVRCIKD